MTEHEALLDFCLRMADSDLILGQRLCELCGRAPAIEEEMALMNVGLDLVGQARNWYEYAAELEGLNRDADHLAFRRDAHQFRNLLITEQPNDDFTITITHQFFFDAWHLINLNFLKNSSDLRVAGIAAKAHKEVTYHLRRSSEWVKRLGDGTDLSHAKMQNAINQLWRFTGELVTPNIVDNILFEKGLGIEPSILENEWFNLVNTLLDEATLTPPPSDAWMYMGGKHGEHTEHLGFILAEMQFLQRAYPDAKVW